VRSSILVCVLCVVVLFAACERDQEAEASTTTTSESRTSSGSRVLEVSCADTIGDRRFQLACYTVEVPADHSDPDGAAMELFVVVVDNPGGEEIGPVAYLVGGPGDAAHLEVDWAVSRPFDVVLVDQRGTGLSKPFLGCPEVDEVTSLLPSRVRAEANALYADALDDCAARLVSEGVDVTLFDSESNARDFEIVRIALGYDQWNLWGGSYGSRLGLEILRLHPETVRAAVFDSVQAPQADLVAEWPDHLRSSVDLLAETCAASPDCHNAYGDSSALLTELVEQLDTQPVDVEVRGNTIRMDGAALVDAVRDALSDTQIIPSLPLYIAAAAEGDLVPLAEIRAGAGIPDPTFSLGMHWSIHCRDYWSVTDRDTLNAALADEPDGFAQWFSYTWFTETCAQWGAGTSPAATRQPVTSDVPTLLMAGRFDPGTPPAWTQLVAEALTNSTYIEFARYGHDQQRCGVTAAENFLRDPTQSPDIPCDPSEPPRWRLP
jgi:pimeloyl-ACP methyl ester carboxylesterase